MLIAGELPSISVEIPFPEPCWRTDLRWRFGAKRKIDCVLLRWTYPLIAHRFIQNYLSRRPAGFHQCQSMHCCLRSD